MQRNSSPLKMFLRAEDSGPTLEEIELHFAESENRRWTTFDESRGQQAKEFTDAEVLRWEGEKAREVRFDETMTTFEDEFATRQADRDGVFRNSEVRYDDTYRANEVERDAIFQRRETSHEEAFRRSQDARERQSEWYNNLKVQLFQKGQGMREEGAKKLEKAMCDDFESILRLQQDAFNDAERRRDRLVDDAVAKVNPMQNDVHESLNHNPALNSPEVPATEEDGLEDGVQQMSKKRSATPPQVPVAVNIMPDLSHTSGPRLPHLRDTPSVTSKPPSPLNHELLWEVASSSEDERSRTSRTPANPYEPSRRTDTPEDQPEITSPQIIPQQDPQDIPHPINGPVDDRAKSPNENIPQAAPAADIEKQFSEGQRRREEIFKQDEMDRERRFNEAESDREGEDRRRAAFLQTMKRHETEFLDVGDRWEEYSGWMERGRDVGETRREQQLSDAQGRRSSIFEQSQSWNRRCYEAMDENETDSFNMLRNRLKELDDAHMKSFDEAKEQESSAFNKSQAGRESKLRRVRNWPSSILPPRNAATPSSITISEVLPRDYTVQSTSLESDEGIQKLRESLMSKARTGLGPGDPVPQTLGIRPHFSTPLPVPGDHDNLRKKERATGFHTAQRRRQFIFEKSQADRKKRFEESARKRQQVFSVNEAKRQQEFEKEQRSRRQIFADDSRKRAETFADSQMVRERTFRENEETRETDFIAAEEQRTNDFTEAQATRDNEFHELHKTLQRQCVESESRRRSEFDRWERGMRDMMRRRDRHWKEKFDTEELKRDEWFFAVFRYVFPHHAVNF